MEGLKPQVGADVQAQIDALLDDVSKAKPSAAPPAPPAKFEGELYVFISYARPDQATAEQVEKYLQAAGIRVFRDTSEIRSGANWDMTIEQALQDTDQMVLLLSNSSMPYRKEVHREWFYFDQEKKPIHPLYIEKCRLHSRMYAYNYLDARGDLNAALEKLLADLGKPFSPPDELVGADRIMVVDTAEAETRGVSEAFAALRDAVCDPKGSVALSTEQVKALIERPPADLDEYRLARIAEWSQPRYTLDNRFVSLTLLIDQGEEAQGPRWLMPEERRRFHDLRDVLAERADSPAFVLLGAPGSGKSTLLRRLQLDDAADHLCGRVGDERLSFYASLNAYRLGKRRPAVAAGVAGCRVETALFRSPAAGRPAQQWAGAAAARRAQRDAAPRHRRVLRASRALARLRSGGSSDGQPGDLLLPQPGLQRLVEQ